MTRPTSVRWRVLALLVLASFAAYVLRLNMSIAGPAMIKDLGLSEVQLGVVLSAFAFGYAAFQLPGGIFGEAVGPRRGLTLIMVVWGLVTILTGLVPASRVWPAAAGLGLVVVLRFLLGVAQAPLYPMSSGSAIATWFPTTAWALPNGLINTGLTLGGAAAGPAIAWMVLAFGWRRSFLVSAPIAFFAAALWWWYYRDDPATHSGINEAELAEIRSSRPPEGDGRSERHGWRLVIVNRDILLLTLSYFCMNYVFYLFFNWFFFYLTDIRHLAPQASGNFTSAQWIVGAVAATTGGMLCDGLSVRLGPRLGCRLTVMGGLLLAAPLLVAGALATGPVTAVVLLSLCFGFTMMTDGAYWVAAMLVAGRHAPAATGVLNTGGNVVGGIGALLVPATAAAFGWTAAVCTGAVFAVVAAVLWVWIRADRPMLAAAPAAAPEAGLARGAT